MDQDYQIRIREWVQSIERFTRVEEVNYNITQYIAQNSKWGNKPIIRYVIRQQIVNVTTTKVTNWERKIIIEQK